MSVCVADIWIHSDCVLWLQHVHGIQAMEEVMMRLRPPPHSPRLLRVSPPPPPHTHR